MRTTNKSNGYSLVPFPLREKALISVCADGTKGYTSRGRKDQSCDQDFHCMLSEPLDVSVVSSLFHGTYFTLNTTSDVNGAEEIVYQTEAPVLPVWWRKTNSTDWVSAPHVCCGMYTPALSTHIHENNKLKNIK